MVCAQDGWIDRDEEIRVKNKERKHSKTFSCSTSTNQALYIHTYNSHSIDYSIYTVYKFISLHVSYFSDLKTLIEFSSCFANGTNSRMNFGQKEWSVS